METITWEQFHKNFIQVFGFDYINNTHLINSLHEDLEITTDWYPLSEDERSDEIGVYNKLNNLSNFQNENIYVIAESSYLHNIEAFPVKNFHFFHKEYIENYGPLFIDDTSFFSFQSKRIWIVHHEDVYGVYELSKELLFQ